jgi:glycosyltransferase involved in cell wall biosynthesis
MRILFFIESLHSGGKERRLVELLTYIKKKPEYELMVVLTKPEIHYKQFLELGIPHIVLERNGFRKAPLIFIKFHKICRKYRPDIVHTWGNVVTFYSLPAIIMQGIPLVNGQIASALPKISKFSKLSVMSKINFRFSKIIVANSYAGLKSFAIGGDKGKVIYNGINLDRFKNLAPKETVKNEYGVKTAYAIIMVASFSDMKDHDKFIDLAKEFANLRKDATFIAVGDGIHLQRIKQRVLDEQITNVIFTGQVDDVESLVSMAAIGVLFSPRGEGISNSIMEYMALGKPVIASAAGGTKEIVKHGINGYLIGNESIQTIAGLIAGLLNDKELRTKMGEAGRKLVQESFTVERMGREFEEVYRELLDRKAI